MPIQIDRAAARELAPRFNEALALARNEFEGLDTHRQYRNAFARLLKQDPLGRVSMMGTDQRDMFIPELRRVTEQCVPSGGHILDLGAGDGQTFALVADSVPYGTLVSIEEPNPAYLADYIAFLETQEHLRLGMALEAGFDELDSIAARSGQSLPRDGSIDLCLALHMIYFVKDLRAGLVRMMRFLKRGGILFVVFTEETVNYTGSVLQEFIKGGGDTGANDGHLSSIAERRQLFGDSGDGQIMEALRAAGIHAEIASQLQPSRLYGHNLADLIALRIVRIRHLMSAAKPLGQSETGPMTADRGGQQG
jgi:SAM-dependent methyltransferase